MFNKYTIFSIVLLFSTISQGMKREQPASKTQKEIWTQHYLDEQEKLTGIYGGQKMHSKIFTAEPQEAMDAGQWEVFEGYAREFHAQDHELAMRELLIHAEATESVKALDILRRNGEKPEKYFSHYLALVKVPFIAYCISLNVINLEQPIESPWIGKEKKSAIEWINGNNWYNAGYKCEHEYNARKAQALEIVQKAINDQNRKRKQTDN